METDTESLCFAPFARSMLAACVQIAACAPDPWKEKDLAAMLDGSTNRYSFVALPDGPGEAFHSSAPLAFAFFLAVPPTVDLQMVAVHPNVRNQGVARRLVEYSLSQLKWQGLEQCLLEARVSNVHALSLYNRLGFTRIARRPNLFTCPAEDGFLMGKNL